MKFSTTTATAIAVYVSGTVLAASIRGTDMKNNALMQARRELTNADGAQADKRDMSCSGGQDTGAEEQADRDRASLVSRGEGAQAARQGNSSLANQALHGINMDNRKASTAMRQKIQTRSQMMQVADQYRNRDNKDATGPKIQQSSMGKGANAASPDKNSSSIKNYAASGKSGKNRNKGMTKGRMEPIDDDSSRDDILNFAVKADSKAEEQKKKPGKA